MFYRYFKWRSFKLHLYFKVYPDFTLFVEFKKKRMVKGLSIVENEYFKSLGQELGTFYGQENKYQLMEHFQQLMRVNLAVQQRENFRERLEEFAKKVASFQ